MTASRLISLVAGGFFVLCFLESAGAIEPGQPPQTKPGIAIGVPAAPPPPGLYLIGSASDYEFKLSGPGTSGFPQVKGSAQEATAYMLWVPGWSFLGATYSSLFAFPFDALAVDSNVAAGFPGVLYAGMHNTFIAPLRLHWNLGNGLFAQAGVGVYVPNGTIAGPLGNSNAGAAYYTIQPDFVLSYVGGGWNLTAYLYYEHNTRNQRSGYTSGDIFHADLTATKQFGKWTLGPVAYYVNQVTSDRSGIAFDNFLTAASPIPGGVHGFEAGRFEIFAVGGLVGYDFGFASLTVYATNEIFARAFGGNSGTPLVDRIPFTSEFTSRGWNVFGRLVYPLWTPSPPTPTKLPVVRK